MMITNDAGYFYAKPMLSAAFMNHSQPDDLVTSDKKEMEEKWNVRILANTKVSKIDHLQKAVHTEKEMISYDKLVLAIGADPIRLPLEGSGAQTILSINDLSDYRTFREKIEAKKHITILGAGLIGCEFAHDLSVGGYQVVVIDLAPQVLGRLLPKMAADILEKQLRKIGIEWHLGTTVARVDQDEGRLHVHLSDQKNWYTDAILSAVGLKPRIDLAKVAGITVGRGICVNHYLETNIPAIYAIGDCAEVNGVVLPYVMPIMHAARALALNLLGQPTELVYPAMPVVVKTPTYPVVICPPSIDAKGEWLISVTDHGVEANFKNEKNELLGFALLGDGVQKKNEILKKMSSTFI
jgi:rubredoxin-NAD+ reductase